jgi:hypothetical protein
MAFYKYPQFLTQENGPEFRRDQSSGQPDAIFWHLSVRRLRPKRDFRKASQHTAPKPSSTYDRARRGTLATRSQAGALVTKSENRSDKHQTAQAQPRYRICLLPSQTFSTSESVANSPRGAPVCVSLSLQESLNPAFDLGALSSEPRCCPRFDGREPAEAQRLRFSHFDVMRIGRDAVVERLDPCPEVAGVGQGRCVVEPDSFPIKGASSAPIRNESTVPTFPKTAWRKGSGNCPRN